MRVLGIDFGSKLIGIAVGESELGVTSARPPVAASGALAKDADAISALLRAEEADCVVLGVPRNLPGRSQRMADVCELLAEKLREKGVVVHLIDEAMTSVESEQRLGSVYNHRERRTKAHGEAARLILERFFNGES